MWCHPHCDGLWERAETKGVRQQLPWRGEGTGCLPGLLRVKPVCAQELPRLVGVLREAVGDGLCLGSLSGAGRGQGLNRSVCLPQSGSSEAVKHLSPVLGALWG